LVRLFFPLFTQGQLCNVPDNKQGPCKVLIRFNILGVTQHLVVARNGGTRGSYPQGEWQRYPVGTGLT